LELGTAEAIPFDPAQGSYEPPVRHAELDWDQPLQQIDRLVRAGHPDQPPYFTYRGQRRYVYGVRPVNPDSVPLERLKRSHGKAPLAWAGGPDGEMVAAVQDAVVAVRWRPVGHTHAVRPLAKQQFP
jgi:methionyl-tRNA formyltransferase